MCVGIAEIDEQTIAQELCNVSVKTLDDFRTCRLIGTDDFPVVFGVETAGECGGVHQVTEHDGQLTSFRVRRKCSRERGDLQGGLLLGRRLCWLGWLSSDFLYA